MRTCTNTAFAETQAERLFIVEERLRAAVQIVERLPHDRGAATVPVGPYHPGRAVALAPSDARTLLRAVLPACLALGRTRKATLRLHEAMASFHAALLGTTDASLIDGAVAAALQLAGELDIWIAEARWRQATRKAGVAWSRGREEVPRRPLLRQSTAAKQEQAANGIAIAIAGPTPPKRRRKTDQATLLLPIQGAKTPPAAAETPISETGVRKVA